MPPVVTWKATARLGSTRRANAPVFPATIICGERREAVLTQASTVKLPAALATERVPSATVPDVSRNAWLPSLTAPGWPGAPARIGAVRRAETEAVSMATVLEAASARRW